jgi:hypothetical protein
LRRALGVLQSEYSLLSSGSGMFFGDGGALSLDITDGYNTNREKAGGDTYEDISSTHRKILLMFYTFHLSAICK